MNTEITLSDLKAQWLADPCWDIEDTEGFEQHRKDLLIWRLQVENERLTTKLNKVRGAWLTLREELGN